MGRMIATPCDAGAGGVTLGALAGASPFGHTPCGVGCAGILLIVLSGMLPHLLNAKPALAALGERLDDFLIVPDVRARSFQNRLIVCIDDARLPRTAVAVSLADQIRHVVNRTCLRE